MIGALRGEIVDLEANGDHAAQVIVDVNGVGYDVTVSARHAAELRSQRGIVQLAVHTHVREGAIQLFGFPDKIERHTFEMLLSAHGVGPALAMAILGVLPPPALTRALASGDLDALTAVPGVGKRTAQRLQLELAQRLDVGSSSGADADEQETGVALAEVREALASLGYSADEIRNATAELPSDEPVEVLLRLALNVMAIPR
jgi:Holliday junction DNA helicase RuvA